MKLGLGVKERQMLHDIGMTPSDFAAECYQLLCSYHDDWEMKELLKKEPRGD